MHGAVLSLPATLCMGSFEFAGLYIKDYIAWNYFICSVRPYTALKKTWDANNGLFSSPPFFFFFFSSFFKKSINLPWSNQGNDRQSPPFPNFLSATYSGFGGVLKSLMAEPSVCFPKMNSHSTLHLRWS